jgi:hypothetical protein
MMPPVSCQDSVFSHVDCSSEWIQRSVAGQIAGTLSILT